MPSHCCADPGTAFGSRKGRLIDEKRRRRAAEQSLAEVQHQRDCLARRLQYLQGEPHPSPAAAPAVASPTSGANVAVRPAAAALPCSRSGSAEGVSALGAVSVGTVAGTAGGGRGGGLALYAGQDLQAPARSAFVLHPFGAAAEPQLPGNGDGSPTDGSPTAALPLSLPAPQPVTPLPPALSPPASCSTPRDMLANATRLCSPTSYDSQGIADQVLVQRPSPPPPPRLTCVHPPRAPTYQSPNGQ